MLQEIHYKEMAKCSPAHNTTQGRCPHAGTRPQGTGSISAFVLRGSRDLCRKLLIMIRRSVLYIKERTGSSLYLQRRMGKNPAECRITLSAIALGHIGSVICNFLIQGKCSNWASTTSQTRGLWQGNPSSVLFLYKIDRTTMYLAGISYGHD